MRIHHFYPRTNNIGDHFVQRGVEAMVRRLRPDVSFELFDVNKHGRDRMEYGLTRRAIKRANSEADLIIVGGSNLYEGNYRWHWGIHLEEEALDQLHVPLLLLGIGSGSGFGAPLHTASKRATSEIRLLNDHATLSGARDLITLAWLHKIGIAKAQLTGDPATFIFNRPLQEKPRQHVLIVVPPRRFWSSFQQFWSVRRHGRPMFKALVSLARSLLESGEKVVVACNDPLDLPLAKSLFDGVVRDILVPQTPEHYFQLVSASSAVVTGRLHTAVVAFSLGVPFVLMNVDQRTEGFIKTYELESWSIAPARDQVEEVLPRLVTKLLCNERQPAWTRLIELRDNIHERANAAIRNALPEEGRFIS
jgi:polysaccharide pyruvyl transferase WcaK-like protein